MNEDIAFIAIPKCASMAMREFCDSNEITFHNHSVEYTKWINDAHERMSGRTFCVIRDPADRLLSAYHFLKGGGVNNEGSSAWNRYCREFASFGDFVERGLRSASRNQVHFIPQRFWVSPPGHETDLKKVEFLRFSHLQEDLEDLAGKYGLTYVPLRRVNASSREDEPEITPEMLLTIREVYSGDYDLIDNYL